MSKQEMWLVELEDGTVHEVATDQRDQAAMEAKQFPPGSLLTMCRFIIWNAMKRQGLTRRSWEQFNNTDCVHTENITETEEEGEGEKRLDPGLSAPSGPGGSTSPSPAGSRSPGPAASSTGTTGT